MLQTSCSVACCSCKVYLSPNQPGVQPSSSSSCNIDQHARLVADVFCCFRMLLLLLQPHTQELQNQASGGK
jgi:hypothetical protein